MPQYPVPAPILSGDVVTINRFLAQPTAVARYLRAITAGRFVADKMLPGKVKASGGAVLYGVSESIESDRDPRLVAPGAEFPRAQSPDGAAALLTVSKYGQDIPLTDEKLAREQGRSAGIVLLKSGNRVIRYVDTITMAAIAAAVTQTQTAVAAWANPATADPLLDIMLAKAQIGDLSQDYEADTFVTTETLAARLVANPKVVAGTNRESDSPIIKSGAFEELGGLAIWVVPAARMPSGVSGFVLDSRMLGFMAYEDLGSPEYAGSPDGVQTWVRRDPQANDQWLIRSRRIFSPGIQEPNACVKLVSA